MAEWIKIITNETLNLWANVWVLWFVVGWLGLYVVFLTCKINRLENRDGKKKGTD